MTPIRRAMLAATVTAGALAVASVPAHAKVAMHKGPHSAPTYAPSVPAEADIIVAGRAGGAPVTTLEQAIGLAYWTNPALLAQRSTLRATDTLYPGARSAYGPQLSLQMRHEFARDRLETQPDVWRRSQGFSSTAELIFSQNIFSFGRRSAAEGAALAEIELGRDQLRLMEAQTMLDVISVYAAVIRDREILAIANENLALLTRQYDSSGKRFGVHEITATDLQQVQTRVEFGRAQVLSAKGQLGASESRFLMLVGALPGALADPSLKLTDVASLEDAYVQVDINSPLVHAAQAREKISRAQIASARAQSGPEVSVQGSGAYGTVTPYQNSLRAAELRSAVVLTMPLIDSGARRAQIERARQTNDADWRLADMALREARQAAASAWDGYQAARQSLDHYRAAADAAEKAYNGAVVQEKAGARTTLDVLDLARDLLTVRTSHVSAKANEYVARASLVSAMGGLEGPLLVPAIRAYDPDGNFQKQDGRGDVPVLTYLLSGIDDMMVGDLLKDRAIRDPAGSSRATAQLP
ncbi:TolC family protein [Sphingobium sufflavum]|uniref:TolC family protein n=1 Tax=Sphingobium sufflavum TaxID=1129547 RepID=UPI001F182964|nr:TolC family protein [Sphingobium sufflavum]MCE7796309.1 TolC family protein [Sphingobium sufflavum]